MLASKELLSQGRPSIIQTGVQDTNPTHLTLFKFQQTPAQASAQKPGQTLTPCNSTWQSAAFSALSYPVTLESSYRYGTSGSSWKNGTCSSKWSRKVGASWKKGAFAQPSSQPSQEALLPDKLLPTSSQLHVFPFFALPTRNGSVIAAAGNRNVWETCFSSVISQVQRHRDLRVPDSIVFRGFVWWNNL